MGRLSKGLGRFGQALGVATANRDLHAGFHQGSGCSQAEASRACGHRGALALDA